MKEWTRFFASMLTFTLTALLFEQFTHLRNPLGAAVGTAPLLLGMSAGAGVALLVRNKSLAAAQLASQRRLVMSIVAAGFAGISALAFGLVLFVGFGAYLAAAPFPWTTALFLLAVSAAGKCGAIVIGRKAGLPLLKAATAVGAASLLTLALMILGGPLLTLLALASAGFAWRSVAKGDAPPVDAGPDTR